WCRVQQVVDAFPQSVQRRRCIRWPVACVDRVCPVHAVAARDGQRRCSVCAATACRASDSWTVTPDRVLVNELGQCGGRGRGSCAGGATLVDFSAAAEDCGNQQGRRWVERTQAEVLVGDGSLLWWLGCSRRRADFHLCDPGGIEQALLDIGEVVTARN